MPIIQEFIIIARLAILPGYWDLAEFMATRWRALLICGTDG